MEPRHILVVSPDSALADELTNAADGLKETRLVVHTATTYGRALDLARSRRPHIVCFEADPEQLGPLQEFSTDLAGSGSDAVLVGAWRGEMRDAGTQSFFIELTRSRVRDFLRRPLSTNELSELLARQFGTPPTASDTGKLITVLSNKGGVGKSTVSTNVAVDLALRCPGRVLLVDLSLQLGTCADLLGLEAHATWRDVVSERQRLDERLLTSLTLEHESGLRVLPAPASTYDATEVDESIVTRVLGMARRVFDYVIVDTSPMMDSVVLAALDLSDRVLVIGTRLVPVVRGTRMLLDVLRELGISETRVQVVLNHAQPNFSTRLRAGDVEEALQRPVDFEVPFDRDNLTAMNTGDILIARTSARFGFGRAIRRIVQDLTDEAPAATPVVEAATEEEQA